MSDRLLAAQGIRRGLEFWPDANHWCQHRLTDNAEDGTKQRCTYQMLNDGMGGSAPYSTNPTFRIAEAEILRVAQARGIQGCVSVCDLNNSNNFDTVKSIVEEAAANLEKVQ